MKKIPYHEVNNLKGFYRSPYLGRLIMWLTIIVSPLLFLAVVIKESWHDYMNELKEAIVIASSPWEKEGEGE